MGALALLEENNLANARLYVSTLAQQYEPHTKPRPFNMMRRRGATLRAGGRGKIFASELTPWG